MPVPTDAHNNNPLNIRPGQPYEGLATPASVGGFCNFISPVWGFRAAFRNYITKFDRGVNTIAKLIAEWAPPNDNNDTAAYIKIVCQKTGFGPDEVIQLKTWDVASKVCYAQTEVESGAAFETYWTQKQMAEGAFRAGIVDAPPPLANKMATRLASAGAAVSGTVAATQSNNPTIQVTLVVATIAMAVIAAIWPAKTKTEG